MSEKKKKESVSDLMNKKYPGSTCPICREQQRLEALYRKRREEEDREPTAKEIMDNSWSPWTKRFIEEQKKIAPVLDRRRLEKLHKEKEDERKLETRTKLYKPIYCRKCHKSACMCPRPDHTKKIPLHSCKDGHRRLIPMPEKMQGEMDLIPASWEVCLDCFSLLIDGLESWRKLSTINAPTDT